MLRCMMCFFFSQKKFICAYLQDVPEDSDGEKNFTMYDCSLKFSMFLDTILTDIVLNLLVSP